MPLLEKYENPKLGYLYVRDNTVGHFKAGYSVLLLTPSAVIRGIQVAQREEHQERIAELDEEWETRNLQLDGLMASRGKELEEQAIILVNQEEEITMLRKKLDSQEARITYLNSRPWWLRALRR